MLLLHALRELTLTFALGAGLSQDIATEDFDFRDEVVGMVGVLKHSIDEVFFIANDKSAHRLTDSHCGRGQVTHLSLTSPAQCSWWRHWISSVFSLTYSQTVRPRL